MDRFTVAQALIISLVPTIFLFSGLIFTAWLYDFVNRKELSHILVLTFNGFIGFFLLLATISIFI